MIAGGAGAEIVAETKPAEEWEDEDATQTQSQQEVWLDGEDGGRGLSGELDAEVEQTQRTDDDEDGDEAEEGEDDDGNDEDEASSSSSASKSVATIPYNEIVLLSLARHNPPCQI